MGRPGRPTRYTKAVQEKADEYVDGGFESCGDAVPSVAGLACELGVTRFTVYEWRKHHDAFSHTLDRLLARQERLSLSGGLRNELNSTIVKLLLANHGYSERIAQDNTSSDGSFAPTRIVIESPDDDSKG